MKSKHTVPLSDKRSLARQAPVQPVVPVTSTEQGWDVHLQMPLFAPLHSMNPVKGGEFIALQKREVKPLISGTIPTFLLCSEIEARIWFRFFLFFFFAIAHLLFYHFHLQLKTNYCLCSFLQGKKHHL